MQGVRLTYVIDDRAARDALDALAGFDSTPMFDDIGAYLDSETARRFREGIDPEGKPWEPSQRAEREGGKTLVDKGHLRDSYTHRVFQGGRAVEHGSEMVYAAVHQFGVGRRSSLRTRRVMPGIPARPVLGTSDEDMAEIDAIVTDHLRRAMQ